MNVDPIRVLVAAAAVGVGLAGLILAGIRGMRQDMRGLRQETRQEIRNLRHHMERIDSHIGELRERMAHVEGLLAGLRDAFVRRIITK